MELNDSLDKALMRAVSSANEELDITHFDQFCMILEKDPKLMSQATKLLANRIQSPNPKEAILALEALEECMDSCGENFQLEINRFKFLNELIKLVSKKHDGDKTPKEISDRILNVLLTWTNKYDHLSKIKEAYSLLKSQGIEHEPPKDIVSIRNQQKTDAQQRRAPDNKNEIKLKKLLQSNRPEDRTMANLMIKNIYREEERKMQLKNRRIVELEKVHENISLLNEMLSNYKEGETTDDEMAIIKDLYRACQNFHPTVLRLAKETQQSEGMLEQILLVNDQLQSVMDRYQLVVIDKKTTITKSVAVNSTASKAEPFETLLSISSSYANHDVLKIVENTANNNPLDELSEIFSAQMNQTANSILMPTPIIPEAKTSPADVLMTTTNDKYFPLDMETPVKRPNGSNVIVTPPKVDTPTNKVPSLDLDSLISGIKSSLMPGKESPQNEPEVKRKDDPESEDEKILQDVPVIPVIPIIPASPPIQEVAKKEIKSLAEIVIDLDNIQPSDIEPRTVLDEPGGIKIMLNFAKDHPSPDVNVIVITTINQGREAITNFQFDASVKKPCKLRLLPASGTNLLGTKPFRPPSDGITQLLLLLNPTKKDVNLTCILTYCSGDDPDPVKESVIMKDVPYEC